MRLWQRLLLCRKPTNDEEPRDKSAHRCHVRKYKAGFTRIANYMYSIQLQEVKNKAFFS